MNPARDGPGARGIGRSRILAAALALVAFGLSGAAGPGGARASCGGNDFPFEFGFDAYVDSVDDAGFVVDRLRVTLPKASTVLPWDPARYALEIDEDAIEAGGFVRVRGSLRIDGTILAQSVEGAEPEFEDGDGVRLVSGVLESIDATGMTVDGHDYAFLEEPDRGAVFLLTSDSHELTLDEVHPGDAVAFSLDVDEDSGDRVAATVLVRPAGDGAVLGGRVTENTLEEGGSFFAHDGLYFEVEGVRAFFPYNEDQAIRAIAREHPDDSDLLERLSVGDGVRMTGWYRDGVFFLEDLHVDGAGQQTLAAREVTAEGAVTRADPEEIEVNGVAFRKPEGRRLRRAADGLRPGDRVRLRARVPDEGEDVVARSVRRLRSR